MKKRALFVGVDGYEYLSPLEGAVADARSLEAFFRERAGYVTELFENPEYPGQVTERVRAAREGLEAGDVLVVYFAGHGAVMDGSPRLLCTRAHPEPVHRDSDVAKLVELEDAADGPQDTVLILDACQEDLAREGRKAKDQLDVLQQELAKQGISLEEFQAQLAAGKIRLRGLFGLFGKGEGRRRDLSFAGEAVPAGTVRPSGRGGRGRTAVLFSCQSGEFSAEFDGHGLFTGALLEELADAADAGLSVQVAEPLLVRVNARMEKMAGKRGAAGLQHAEIRSSGSAIELVEGRRDPRDAPGSAVARTVPVEKEPFTCGTGGIPMRWCMPTTGGEWRKAAGADWFWMGAQEDEDGANCFVPCDRRAAETRHPVRLTRGFWIGQTEVTQRQWHELTGRTVLDLCAAALADGAEYEYADTVEPERPQFQSFRERKRGASPEELCHNRMPDAPVYFASWNDAKEFCAILDARERAAGRVPAGYEWRLPTEAEWEHACRAGSQTVLPNGAPLRIARMDDGTFVYSKDAPALDEIAWYGGNSSVGWEGAGPDTRLWSRYGIRKQYPGGTAAMRSVFGKKANAWDIRDMLGNVWEWCEDWLDRYPPRGTGGAATDPVRLEKPSGLAGRVVRGGSWYADAQECRPAARWRHEPGFRNWTVGFRVVLGPKLNGGE